MKPYYIVEDDPLIRRYLRELLTRVLGVPVVEWTEGQDVVATVEAEQPPLVLLDITLRGATLDGRPTDGLKLCRRIKQRLGGGAPPVMLLTAHAVEGDRERFLAESGADDYQAKPVEPKELASRIKSMLRIKSQADELARLSICDSLTGLYNHRYFHEILHTEFQRARRHENELSLIMIDLDRFKSVNDTFGHQFGDYVLGETSRIVMSTARETDIACRYGGEELAVICPETSLDNTARFAERLRANIAAAVFKNVRHQAKITVSVGVGSISLPGIEDKDILVQRTDDALYEAKRRGRNQVVNAY